MKTILLAAVSLLTVPCFAQLPEYDRASQGLKGPVKSVSESSFLAKEKFGDLVKDGDKFYVEMAEFSKPGFLTGGREEDIDDEDVTVITSKLVYDGNNRLIEINRYGEKNKLENKVKLHYSEKGLCTAMKVYDGEGDLVRKSEFTYNSKDQLAKEVDYEGETKDLEVTFEYNSSGKVSKKINGYSNRKKEWVTSTTTFVYNSKGLATSRTETDSEGKVKTYVIEYDQYDNLVRETADKETYTTCKYKYDAQGNWIYMEQIRGFLGTKVEYINERVIKYY